jgi:hypothetical protein
MTLAAPQPTQQQPTPSRHRAWRAPLVGGAALVALTLAAAWGVSAVDGRGDDPTPLSPVAQVTALQNGCDQWLAQSGLNLGSTQRATGWCEHLSEWMRQHMSATGLGPQLMWASADQLRATCRSWAATDDPVSPGTVSGVDWCNAMVAWMDQHTRSWSGSDNWDSWTGSMTGRSTDSN